MRYEIERIRIVNICRELAQREYFLGTWGNVSVRVPDGILLTPSRVEYDSMTPEDIVLISLEGEVLEGTRTPTSEKEVHRRILVQRPDLGAVIHAHTEAAMAVSVLSIDVVPCLVEEMSQLLGGEIPLTKQYVPAEQHEQLGFVAAAAIEDKSAVLLRNHGPVCAGRTLEEAFLTAQVTEKACSIYLRAAAAGCLQPIDQEYAQSERYRYLYKYGKEKT